MNRTVENGSNQGVRPIPSDHSDDYFIELCARSTAGALSMAELRQLELHLSVCSSCREIKAQYDRVLATTLPALAANHARADDDHTSDSWSMEQAEASLMARIDRENISPDKATQPSRASFRWWHLAWPYAAAAVFLGISICVGYRVGYRVGVLHGRRSSTSATSPTSTTAHAQSRLDDPRAVSISPPAIGSTDQQATKLAELRNQLQASLSDVARLKEQKISVENELAERNAGLERNSQERVELERRLSLAQSNAQSLQDKLALATATRPSRDTTQSQALQAQVNELTASLRDKDQEIARHEELLQHDRDIRNLVGARDLYIAEIYDVAKTGKTQKPFGRVFYTQGKSLVFYAYDLDQQPGVKLASTFQAWGRKGVDQQHDINLGIFYQDDQNMKRWILKSNDPATLAQIDAVFVTVEPNGESSKPSGKPLLFTYLRLTPNHP